MDPRRSRAGHLDRRGRRVGRRRGGGRAETSPGGSGRAHVRQRTHRAHDHTGRGRSSDLVQPREVRQVTCRVRLAATLGGEAAKALVFRESVRAALADLVGAIGTGAATDGLRFRGPGELGDRCCGPDGGRLGARARSPPAAANRSRVMFRMTRIPADLTRDGRSRRARDGDPRAQQPHRRAGGRRAGTAHEFRPPRLPRRHRHPTGADRSHDVPPRDRAQSSRACGPTRSHRRMGRTGASEAARTTRTRTPMVRARSTLTT